MKREEKEETDEIQKRTGRQREIKEKNKVQKGEEN